MASYDGNSPQTTLNEVIGTGDKNIRLYQKSGGWDITAPLYKDDLDGVSIVGMNTCTLNKTGSGTAFQLWNVVDFRIVGVTVSASGNTGRIFDIDGMDNCYIDAKVNDSDGIPFAIHNATNSTVYGRAFNTGLYVNGMEISGALTDNLEVGFSIEDGGNFGCYLYDNVPKDSVYITHGWGKNNRLEGLGVTRSCSVNGSFVYVEGSGDNGISLTGANCTFKKTETLLNNYAGVCFWGSNNTIKYAKSYNNSQYGANIYGGISFKSGFGGEATNNFVWRADTYDTQETPTQKGVRIVNANSPWEASSAISDSNRYRYNTINGERVMYYAQSAGTTGAIAPTHLSGINSDGSLDWEFLFISQYNLTPTSNTVYYAASGNTEEVYNPYPTKNKVVAI